ATLILKSTPVLCVLSCAFSDLRGCILYCFERSDDLLITTRTSECQFTIILGLFPTWVCKADWVSSGIKVSIRTVGKFGRIEARPPPEPGRTIPRCAVVQSMLLIALLASVSLALGSFDLTAHRLVRRTAIRCVFLVGND